MPWNLSASVRSSVLQRNTVHRLSRAGSASSALPPPYNDRRLTSASPLIGRGSALGLTLPDRLSHAGSLVPGGGVTSFVNGGGDFGLGGSAATDNDTDMRDVNADIDGNATFNTQQQEEAFEMFGPAAGIDTQTAADSQLIKNVLDVEGRNFLEFVEMEIARRALSAEDEEEGGGGSGGENKDSVTFVTLLPSETNTAVVAAQGLLHCLALATKGLLQVKQVEDFGEIRLKPVAVVG